MIQITKPFLPPIVEYQKLLEEIWERNWLTNNGPLSERLEHELADYLDVENFVLVTNGTISLQMAFKALELKGEVITTPFSYVATTSSLIWEGLKPVFVDIKPDSFNINEKLIEESVTENTSAILATHVFGVPCQVGEIEQIAKRNNLRVIYDAAHAFGVKVNGQSVFKYGNVSSLSMHATKLFHSVEGGALIASSKKLSYQFSKMRNFGHLGHENFNGLGINAKCSELHSAMGIVNMKYIDQIMASRKEQFLLYKDYLGDLSGVRFQEFDEENVEYNYSYCPIVFENEDSLEKAVSMLNTEQIFPRRYFYPALNKLPYIDNSDLCPVAEKISNTILCLPLYFGMEKSIVEKVAGIVEKSIVGI